MNAAAPMAILNGPVKYSALAYAAGCEHGVVEGERCLRCEAEAELAKPPSKLPAGHEMYVVSVRVERIVEVLPMKKPRTTAAELVMGELPGLNPAHVRNLYWRNIEHRAPDLLDLEGRPIRQRRLRSKKDLIVRKKEAADE